MSLLGVMVLAAVAAGPVKEKLARAAPVSGALAAEARLRPLVAIGGSVPGMAPLGPELRARRVTGDVPDWPRLPAGGGVALEVGVEEYRPAAAVGAVSVGDPGAFGALGSMTWTDAAVMGIPGVSGMARPLVWEAPVFAARGCAVAQEVDPFLAPIDVWGQGALGQIRRQAIEAAARGDRETFERLLARYWEAFNQALERRRVLGERGRGGDGR